MEEERDRVREEACQNRVRLREDQLPQFECPVCREALQSAEEWLHWGDIPELEKRRDHKEEVGNWTRNNRKMIMLKDLCTCIGSGLDYIRIAFGVVR